MSEPGVVLETPKIDDRTKRELIRKYFKPFPRAEAWVTVFGALVLFGGIAAAVSPGIAEAASGVIIAGIGTVGLVSYNKGLPTDQQIDQWLEEDRQVTMKKALDRLGTLKEETLKDPLEMTKPVYWNVPGLSNPDVRMKRGKDGLLRFSAWEVAIFNLTDKYLGVYKAVLSMMSGATLNDRTEELFYRDIVKVGTAQESYVLADGTKVTGAESFVLTVSSGDSIGVRDVTPKLEERGLRVVPTSSMEKTIQAIRTMLREKKT